MSRMAKFPDFRPFWPGAWLRWPGKRRLLAEAVRSCNRWNPAPKVLVLCRGRLSRWTAEGAKLLEGTIMRTSLLAAAAAAALLSAGAATAQNSGQTDVPSARHQNSAHANAPGTPDQTDSGAMPGPRGGMENTSDQNRNGNDVDMNAGGNMAPEQNGMRNGQMDRERMRVNETGNRTHLRLTTTQR